MYALLIRHSDPPYSTIHRNAIIKCLYDLGIGKDISAYCLKENLYNVFILSSAYEDRNR